MKDCNLIVGLILMWLTICYVAYHTIIKFW
jgi:hypothetical protein